jgi:hypothetical protein
MEHSVTHSKSKAKGGYSLSSPYIEAIGCLKNLPEKSDETKFV